MRGAHITSDSVYAADFHPGVTRCAYIDCNIEGGLSFAGLHNRVIGGRITPTPSGECVHLHSLHSLDLDILGVTMEGDAQARALIWWDRPPADEYHPEGGRLRIAQCRLTADGCPIYLRNRTPRDDLACTIVDNTVTSTSGTPARWRYWAGASPWARVDRAGNVWSTQPSLGSYVITDNAAPSEVVLG